MTSPGTRQVPVPAGAVVVDREVLATLVTSLDGLWSDHEFARGQPRHERDQAAIAQARQVLRGRPAKATAVTPGTWPLPAPAAPAR